MVTNSSAGQMRLFLELRNPGDVDANSYTQAPTAPRKPQVVATAIEGTLLRTKPPLPRTAKPFTGVHN